MSGNLYTDDLNKIKERYIYSLDNVKYSAVNELNYYYFLRVIWEIEYKYKFDELYEKIENGEKDIDEMKKCKDKQLFKSLIKQFNEIKNKAKDNLNDSNQLLEKIEEDYLKNKNIKNIDEIFVNLCREIINSAIDNFIKYEKAIIIIVENYKSLVHS